MKFEVIYINEILNKTHNYGIKNIKDELYSPIHTWVHSSKLTKKLLYQNMGTFFKSTKERY